MSNFRLLSKRRSNKNNSIEFLRFVLCVVVFLHHAGHANRTHIFRGGYQAVDVFFVISGMFLMNHFQKRGVPADSSPEREAVRYFWNRIRRCMPAYVFAWLLNLVTKSCILGEYSLGYGIKRGIWELILLKCAGLGRGFAINNVSWYVSALCLASLPIYWILCRLGNKGHTDKHTLFAAPVIFALCAVYMLMGKGSFWYWTQPAVFLTFGFIRAFGDMGIGCTAAAVIRRLNERLQPSKMRDCLATVFEGAGWLLVIAHMYFCSGYSDAAVPVTAACLLISMSVNNSYIKRLVNCRISTVLGYYSYPVFLNQMPAIMMLTPKTEAYGTALSSLIIFMILFVFSICSDTAVNGLCRLADRKQS